MNLENIDGHSFRPDLLTGGYVLDAGARGFSFSSAVLSKGCKSVALDPDPEVCDPKIDGLTFVAKALSLAEGPDTLILNENVEARHLASVSPLGTNYPQTPVEKTTVASLMKDFGIESWDCVKLDIEGSEYDILLEWPGPIAKQITVEFHDHVEKRPKELYDQIYEHLGKWYAMVHQVPGDTLFVLREFLQ